VDYGLATLKPRHSTECPGYTPAFAAPEQVTGMPPIPEMDIFGLGASMIYALGGDHHSASFPETVDRRIRDFFLAMVAHDPMKRPNSANELLTPLRELRLNCFGRTESGKELKIS
jgi:serine/threonine protein kinase